MWLWSRTRITNHCRSPSTWQPLNVEQRSVGNQSLPAHVTSTTSTGSCVSWCVPGSIPSVRELCQMEAEHRHRCDWHQQMGQKGSECFRWAPSPQVHQKRALGAAFPPLNGESIEAPVRNCLPKPRWPKRGLPNVCFGLEFYGLVRRQKMAALDPWVLATNCRWPGLWPYLYHK